jgi:hypothetical protein
LVDSPLQQSIPTAPSISIQFLIPYSPNPLSSLIPKPT